MAVELTITKIILLLNDICRFWKTLLLNYENKRRFKSAEAAKDPQNNKLSSEQEEAKIKQKVRNFKLKYSRMTTCFATIAALASQDGKIDAGSVLELTKRSPYERLALIPERMPIATGVISDILDSYAWFLNQTGLRTATLDKKFSNEKQREEMFARAKEYGDLMFQLLSLIDVQRPDLKLFRNLVI